MKSLQPHYLERFTLKPELLSSIRALGEYKGKEELYNKQPPDALEKLLESAMIQSVESSNRIEGVTAPHTRIKKIVTGKAEPKTRSELEIAGYRDALNLIHQSHPDIPLSENVLLQFHSMLYRYTTKKHGTWKKGDNEIVEMRSDGTKLVRFKPVSAFETPRCMEQMLALYNDYAEKESYDSLLLIPLFIFDFLCVHPFTDGNGRISRLLTLLLLYQAGYHVGKYISLERIIEGAKSGYYGALEASSARWHDGAHDISPWLSYFYGTLIAAYKEFETRVGVFRGKGSKTEQIKAQIERFVKPFSIMDIEAVCPNISRDMIRKILRELRDDGLISSSSMGRGAKWVKKESR